jgi:hypothetical protein
VALLAAASGTSFPPIPTWPVINVKGYKKIPFGECMIEVDSFKMTGLVKSDDCRP